MVHTDELIRRMIAEYVDGADEDELLNRYEMRKDKWSKIKNGSLRRLPDLSYPIVRESEVAEREEIAGWLSGGESMARIAKEMGIPYSRVRRIAAELKAEGMVVERRSRRLAINDEATINEVWDEWHYAYAEVRARYGVNQRIIAAIYKARGIPSQTMPFPVAWEDLRCKELPSKGFKENCATVEREVDEWLQTLLGD